MKKYMELPAGYTALSEDEMTYTSGGSAVGGVVTVVGVAVLASSYVWGISQAKDWLSVSSNRKGNLFTVLGLSLIHISPHPQRRRLTRAELRRRRRRRAIRRVAGLTLMLCVAAGGVSFLLTRRAAIPSEMCIRDRNRAVRSRR